MNANDRHSIAFLLTLGALPLGCPAPAGDDPNASSTGSTTNDPSSTTSTAEGTGTEDPSASTTSPSTTTSATTSAESTESSGATDPDTGYATESTGGYACRGIEIPELCTAHSAHYVKCNPRYARYREDDAYECACILSYYGRIYGPECVAALEDYYACITATPCAELRDERNDPCGTELRMFSLECFAGGPDGGESSGGA